MVECLVILLKHYTSILIIMATKPGSVTTRRYIRRNDGEAAESTSTLVLTSPEGYFVDIRPLKESGTSSILPLPGVSRDVVEPIPGTADISRLQWAFAGRAVTTERPDGTQHCAWTHLVDSQTTAVEDEVDEGIMEIRQERGHDGNLYEWVSLSRKPKERRWMVLSCG